ncbi:MAG: hypothetical protein MUE44_15080 [Oscillatoriaceae cyanobacterium Prado104]|nr:hypothetical protein [Oscillatoriaceae cyanobacterium Prado104]
MSENDDSKQFFPDDEIDRDRIVVEVPINPHSPYQERVPLGYDPMSEIYLRGRAFRGLAGGRIPWWVLISGWIFFGSRTLLVLLISAIPLAWFGVLSILIALPILILVAIPMIILWRGTIAKISIDKNNNKRRYSDRQ